MISGDTRARPSAGTLLLLLTGSEARAPQTANGTHHTHTHPSLCSQKPPREGMADFTGHILQIKEECGGSRTLKLDF